MPKLSVVIPTYNRKLSLLHTLDALRKQSLPSDQFEVIIVSDGSTDGSKEAVAAENYTFSVRFLEQANSGPSVARNYGSAEAKNEIIVFLDDDIEPVREFLEVHSKLQENRDDLVVIGPQSMPPKEWFPVWIAWEHKMLEKQYDKFRSGEWSAGPNNLYSGNFSVPRAKLLEVGGFDEHFKRQEDVELGFRLHGAGLKFTFAGEADGYHRPVRTWKSWLTTPYLYGVRDVEMSRDKGEATAMNLAKKHFAERSPVTQKLGKLVIGKPVVEPVVMGILKLAPIVLDKIGMRGLALNLLSILFNLRYLQGMAIEIGGANKMWAAIGQS